MIPAFTDSKIILFRILLTVTIFLILIFFSGISDSVNRNTEKIFASVKGETAPDSNIVIIHISENDIENVGPWPIKRSYYALLINTLSNCEVEAIGLEVFLSAKFVTQTLYDNLLVKEIEKAGKVVLGSEAGNVKQSGEKFLTDSLSFPSPKLLNENFTTGHLNFFTENGIKIPAVVSSDDLNEKAFSVELSGKNPGEPVTINFISSWKKFQSYSLLDFFQLVQNDEEELNKLRGKTVIIGISDQQIAAGIDSYYDEYIPGVALHAFAVDNLLNDRYLNTTLFNFSKILFGILLLGVIILPSILKKNILITYIISFVTLIIISFILFSFSNITLAYSFLIIPLIFLALFESVFSLIERKYQLEGAIDETKVLKSLLDNKEAELNRLQKELNAEESGSAVLVDKIKKLKTDIEKLKEKEEDETKAELISSSEAENFHGIIFRSKVMASVADIIKKTAPEDANILILGESGTGKELAARAVHALSKRGNNNFVAVNCGALSDTLLESELFGHVKGAFTGAVTDKVGRFEAADKGTIFLDEVAETSENFQVKLLRVLQTGDFEKVGSSKTLHADVRIVAATNKNLETAVREKKFREDLYYRLNVIKIELPPLRERKEDIEILAQHFVKKESSNIGLSKAALDALVNYSWKGNIRELEAVMKRAVIFTKSAGRELIQLADLPDEIVKDFKFDFEDLVIDSLRNKKFSHSSITEIVKEIGNVNRTVVSENFRGYSLKTYVENNFDIDNSVRIISESDEEEVNERVKAKLELFLRNIESDVNKVSSKDFETVKSKLNSKYKNLPQRFHIYLDEVIKSYLK